MSHPKTYQDRNGPAVVSIGKNIILKLHKFDIQLISHILKANIFI